MAWDAIRGVAYVSDADNQAVHVVDPSRGTSVTTPLGGTPEQLVPMGPGRIAIAMRDRNEVSLVSFDEHGSGRVVTSSKVPTEPWGLSSTPHGDVLVTSAWGHAVTELDGTTMHVRWSVDVPREPRGIVVTQDGARAFVTHLVGDSITVIDLAADRPATHGLRVLGAAFRNRVDDAIGVGTLHRSAALAYSAALSDGGTRLFVPHLAEQTGSATPHSVPGAYGGVPLEEETTTASVAVVAARDESLFGGPPPQATRNDPDPLHQKASLVSDKFIGFTVPPPASPARQARASAVVGNSLFVVSQGTREVVELDARTLDPAMNVVRRIPVGEGPTGLAVDVAGRRLLVWNQLSHDLTVVALDATETSKVAVAEDPLPHDVALGRRLFLTETDRRISRDGRACAACHPDGRDDGLVLSGRLDHGPFGWEAKHTDLRNNMRETMGRLGGGGVPTKELTALAAYLRQGLVQPSRAPEASHDAERGRELFASSEVGCSGCHALDSEGSDRQKHDVGSRTRADMPLAFRTPPLKFVGGTGPYFHDGRYATLEQLIDSNNDVMGNTIDLSEADRRALIAFLRTL